MLYAKMSLFSILNATILYRNTANTASLCWLPRLHVINSWLQHRPVREKIQFYNERYIFVFVTIKQTIEKI